MIAIPLLAVLLWAAPQESEAKPTTSPDTSAKGAVLRSRIISPKEIAKVQAKAEEVRRQAAQINDRAGRIHSEEDARKVVDEVAEVLTNHRHLLWAARSYRRRVAHAEFEAVSSGNGLIPEQRIVDVWNQYVREIDAPEEALVTVAELHNLRDATYTSINRYLWQREGFRTIWTMPNIYALDSAGHVADGCRALETLKLIHDMHDNFMAVRIARTRVAQGGWLISERMAAPGTARSDQPLAIKLTPEEVRTSSIHSNLVQEAAHRYKEAHGGNAYDQMIRRLFDELFPAD